MARSRDEYLADALQAASEIVGWTTGVTFEQYRDFSMLRRAVERNFDIIAEALKAAEERDPDLAETFPNIGDIKGYHVILAHRYFTIDDHLVWDAVQSTLPVFLTRVRQVLADR